MKKSLFLLFLGVLFLSSPLQAAKSPVYKATSEHMTTLSLGERFVYHIKYLGLTVGEAISEVKDVVEINGRTAYHIEVRVRSRSVIRLVYPVDDIHHSYIDAEHFHSLKYEKKLKEGDYRAHEVITYDQEMHEAIYESKTNGTQKAMFISKNILDPIAAGFWFRLQEIKANTEMKIPVHADEKNWELEVKVGEKEEIKMGKLGKFDAVKIYPKLKFEGFFVRRGKVEGWIGLDKKRIPLQMKVKVPILGSVVVKLAEYDPGVLA